MKVSTQPQFKIRLSHELKEALKKESELNKRSINSEICYHLEKAYGLNGKNQEAV
ncbi:Arc family DNA-binding protein [Shewanella decolorationis]|uniref:Arc family DNA-binding protein n=1 Tax=Shewanella decolorationis TaxID=256839 RepID=UPI0010571E32